MLGHVHMAVLTVNLGVMPRTARTALIRFLLTSRHFSLSQTHRDATRQFPATPFTIVNDYAIVTAIHVQSLAKFSHSVKLTNLTLVASKTRYRVNHLSAYIFKNLIESADVHVLM